MKTNEYGVPLDHNGYAPSILQEIPGVCHLCFRSDEKLDRHEVFGGADREKSKRLGLWVLLCHKTHHIFGPAAVHNCRAADLALKREAQEKAMTHYGLTTEEFIRLFGRNYREE